MDDNFFIFDQPTSESSYYIHVVYEIDKIMREANEDYSAMTKKRKKRKNAWKDSNSI
jgi:hypothetical protein